MMLAIAVVTSGPEPDDGVGGDGGRRARARASRELSRGGELVSVLACASVSERPGVLR